MHLKSAKAGIALAIILVLSAGAFAACTGPQPLQTRLKAHPDAQIYTDLGNWFGDHNQYACAADAFQDGLKLEPGSAKLSYLLGLTLLRQDNPKDAISPLQKSIQIDPKVLKPHLVLAAAFNQLKQQKEAADEWLAALQIDAHSTMALDGLAKTLIAAGDYTSAIGVLKSAEGSINNEDLTLDLAEAYDRAGMLNDAVLVLTEALRKRPVSLRLSSPLVTDLARQGHYEEATKLAARAVGFHPGDIPAQILYLHVLVLSDDVQEAQPLAHKLLIAAPHEFGVLYLNGVLERESGKYVAARDHLQQAIALDPDHYNCRYNLGIVLEQLQDPQGAREQLEKALALGATEPEVRFELAKVLRTLGETDAAQQQMQLYQQEAQAKSNRTLAASKSAQGDQELAGGDPQKAVVFYGEAVAALPQDAMLNFKLALALDRTGDTTAERAALEKAVKIDPAFALAQNQLGYLDSRDGDPASAEDHFRRALQAAPSYTQAWVSLAATLGMESRFPEAQQAVANALRLDPKNPDALRLRQDLTAQQAQR